MENSLYVLPRLSLTEFKAILISPPVREWTRTIPCASYVPLSYGVKIALVILVILLKGFPKG